MFDTKSKSLVGAVAFLIFVLSLGVSAKGISDSNGGMNAGVREGSAGSEATLRAIVARARLDILRWPTFSDYRLQLEALYQRSGYAPVWLHKGHPTPQALAMISILQQADSKGLIADDYDSERWPERLAGLQTQHSPSDEARFDAALSVCTMRYVSDLRMGKINPRHFEFGRDIGPKEMDLTTLLESRLVKSTDLKSALDKYRT